MKRKTRKILMVLAMATISAFGVLFASCGAGDWLNEKVDQLTCKHEYDDGIELESATCSEYGKVLKTCTICYYEKTEKINKLPHTETVVAAEAPTCTKDGKTDGVVCSVCDEIIVRQKSVPKLGHDITILEAVEPTCLTSGKTEGKYCNRCNETVVEQKTISALGHKVTTTYGKAATCTESGLTNGQACARCATVYVAQEVIPATGHTYGDIKMVELPTCLESGLSEQTCTICGSVKKHSIRPTGHSFEDGLECTVCGFIDVSALAKMSNVQVELLTIDSPLDAKTVYRAPVTDQILFDYNVTVKDSYLDSLDAEIADVKVGDCSGFIFLEITDYFVNDGVYSSTDVVFCLSTSWSFFDLNGNEITELEGYIHEVDLFSGLTYAFSDDMKYFYFTISPDKIDLDQEYYTIGSDFTIRSGYEKVIL